jgi:hypothetical protein
MGPIHGEAAHGTSPMGLDAGNLDQLHIIFRRLIGAVLFDGQNRLLAWLELIQQRAGPLAETRKSRGDEVHFNHHAGRRYTGRKPNPSNELPPLASNQAVLKIVIKLESILCHYPYFMRQLHASDSSDV